MESPIDERYRLDLISYQLEGVEAKNGGSKFIFYCPFCQISRVSGKSTNKKGGMFYVDDHRGWRFNCKRAGCLSTTTFYRFLLKLNPLMAEKYQRDREASGLTGKGTDTPKIRRNRKRDETL